MASGLPNQRGNYQASMTGMLCRCDTVGRRSELDKLRYLSDKAAIYLLAFCEGFASAASHLADGVYNRQPSFLLGESSVIQNGSRICRPGRWTPKAAT